MLRIFLLKWFFCGFIIILQVQAFHATDSQNQETIDKDTPEAIDWPGLITDLRGSWQSPLLYLEKRGYLPPGNENLLEEKLNELRGMKTEDSEEKLNENVAEVASITSASSNSISETDKLNQKPQEVASGISDPSVSSLAESVGPGNPTATFTANNNVGSVEELVTKNDANAQYQFNSDEPIVTYVSRQQLSDDVQDDLFKGLTIDLNADVDKDADQETEEEVSESDKNDIAYAKATGKSHSKSKSKKKCKSKSKTKTKTNAGFFQSLKEKFSSMFKKSDKVAATKKSKNKKLALSPDFASYYVKYLAHRDNPDTNSLSVNDMHGQYTSVRYYGDLEPGGKGLYRRDYSGKDLALKDNKIENSLQSDTQEKDEESNNLESADLVKGSSTGAKDFSLREFPFKDFNLGDIEIKDMKSESNEDVKVADLKNFDSKDEGLNQIVHSLAEQKTTDAKGLQGFKGEKLTTKDDLSLKGLTLSKDAENDALDDSENFMQNDFQDLSIKESLPTFYGKCKDYTGKNVQAASTNDINDKDDLLGDFDKPNFNMKLSDNSWKGDVSKRINLQDFDFNLPDLGLGLKGFASKSKIAPNTKEFGNLGMSSLKMKTLEADAQSAATSSFDNDNESNDSSLSGHGMKIHDIGVNDVLSKENDYGMREELDAEDETDEKNHVAAKQINAHDFDLSSLSTRSDDSNLELDRQFTRQVLDKVMRSSAQNDEHNKQ